MTNQQSDTWDHVCETISMIYLSIAQINFSIQEGDNSVNSLVESFVFLVDDIHAILSTLKDSWGDRTEAEQRALVDKVADDLCDRVNAGIVAFQFYDRLSQRLNNIQIGLSGIRDIINDPVQRNEPERWRSLHQRIRGRYTMETEREIFDSIMAGKTLEETIALMKQKPDDGVAEGDVELF